MESAKTRLLPKLKTNAAMTLRSMGSGCIRKPRGPLVKNNCVPTPFGLKAKWLITHTHEGSRPVWIGKTGVGSVSKEKMTIAG